LAIKPVVFDRDTPPADGDERKIWAAAHAIEEIFPALAEEFGWGAAVQALLLHFTKEIEAQDQVASGAEKFEMIAATWRSGLRMHATEQGRH
jgi:hypothetical protein